MGWWRQGWHSDKPSLILADQRLLGWQNEKSFLWHQLLRGGTVTATIENILIKLSIILFVVLARKHRPTWYLLNMLTYHITQFSSPGVLTKKVGRVSHSTCCFDLFCFFYWCPQSRDLADTILTSMVCKFRSQGPIMWQAIAAVGQGGSTTTIFAFDERPVRLLVGTAWLTHLLMPAGFRWTIKTCCRNAVFGISF